MNPFEFVIAIIALSFLYKLVDVWVKQKAGRRSEGTASSAILQRLGEVEVSDLEPRCPPISVCFSLPRAADWPPCRLAPER
jgi:hypothetical protein